MSNPFRSLQYLPWSTLLLSAGLTVLVATAIDVALVFAIAFEPAIAPVFLGAPVLYLFWQIAVTVGIGALSIVLTLNFFRQIPLRADTIWALVACVLLLLLIKAQISAIPSLFVQNPGYLSIMGTAVGAFTQGRRYWRY